MSYVSKVLEGFRIFLRKPNWTKLLALVILGMPPGLIFIFILNTLQFWLKSYGLSKITIGMFSLAILPNALKFIWAHFLEIIKFPLLSRYFPNRYAWSIGLCIFIVITLALISFQNPSQSINLVFGLVIIMSSLTASLEVNLDAIRIEIVPKEQQGYASSFYAFGYRVGTIIGAFGVLYISEYFSWNIAFIFIISILFCSAVFLGICARLFSEESEGENEENSKNFLAKSYREKIRKAIEHFKQPFLSFIKSRHWFVILFFIFIFRMGDNFINNMSNIFYLDIGFSQLDIANVVKFFGVFFTIVGTFVGGYLVMQFSDIKALLLSGVVHVISNFMYLVQSYVGYNITLFYIGVAFENITAGMVTIAFVAYLSNLCKKPYTGSHYALFSSIWYLSTSCSAFGGVLASYFSWPVFFLLCIMLGFFSLFILFFFQKSLTNSDT